MTADHATTPPPGLSSLQPTDPLRIDRFRILGRIGSGGMGVVYGAVDDRDTCVAVKMVHRIYAGDPEFRARFARETALIRRVHGPGIPGFLGAETSVPLPWLATEYVLGSTLGSHMKRHGPLNGAMLAAFAAGTAEALAGVHAAGVVHRDLKPGNVILSPTGPVVLDFGIARAVEGTALTRSGGMVGTVGWISPEQYRGEPVTERTDLFTWGALVAFAARGHPAFGEGGSDVVPGRILTAEPELDGVPPVLRAVVSAALDKDPACRPSAREALQAVCTSVDPAATAASAPLIASGWTVPDSGHLPEEWRRHAPPRRSWLRRRPVHAAVAAGLACVLVAGGAWWALDGSEATLATAPLGDSSATEQRVTEDQDLPEEYRPLIEEGYVEVRTEPVSHATLVERVHAPQYLGPDAESMDRIEVHLLAARQHSDRVEIVVGVEYLLDFGDLSVSSEDFLLATRLFAHGEDEQLRMETVETVNADEVVVDAEEPRAELTAAFDDAPVDGMLAYAPPELVGDRFGDPGMAPEDASGYCYDADADDGPFPQSPGFTEYDPENSCLPGP